MTTLAPPQSRASCAQCGDLADRLHKSEYGLLCDRCAFRQVEHDDRRDTFGGISAASLGFCSGVE